MPGAYLLDKPKWVCNQAGRGRCRLIEVKTTVTLQAASA